jgi:hypothetical protein
MQEPIFADTSAWFAIKDANDANHASATEFMNQRPYLITTNYVIDETITLIRAHLGHRDAVDIGERLWRGELATIVWVTHEDEQTAWELFKRYQDKEFSFTDCTSFVVMRRLGITHAFTFDEDFEQTGKFVRVPG